MMRALGAGLLLIAMEAGAFSMLPPANTFRRMGQGATSSTSAISRSLQLAPARRGRYYMSSTSAEDGSASDGAEPIAQRTEEGKQKAPSMDTEQTESEMVTRSVSTVFVAGGSGFVGSEVCKQLVDAGCNVISLSRKGAPAKEESWVKSVKWVEGNALDQELYRSELRKSDTVVSCVGGFGKTDAYMELVNGETNIKLAEAAADAGVKQFVFVSVHDYKAPSFIKRVGYFDGKRRAEKIVGELFGAKGVILKPAVIYGERAVKVTGLDGKEQTLNVPLQRVGGPLARITSTSIGKKIAESGLPLADVVWTQPLSVGDVAKSVVRCCLDGAEDFGGKGKDSGDSVVLKVQDIVQMVA